MKNTMRYFLDTEFIEGFHKPLFGKKRHFIDLISIGICCEDGREYYAISNEYDYKDADNWVKENVILKMYQQQPPSFKMQFCDDKTFHKYCGKPNNQISQEILEFFGCGYTDGFWAAPTGIEVYGYYSDYDWVLFCSLFGRMIDLPKGFPMYCRDLKQTLDTTVEPNVIKLHTDYPKQKNEHNALADAQWNFALYKFLNKLNSDKNVQASVATEVDSNSKAD